MACSKAYLNQAHVIINAKMPEARCRCAVHLYTEFAARFTCAHSEIVYHVHKGNAETCISIWTELLITSCMHCAYTRYIMD